MRGFVFFATLAVAVYCINGAAVPSAAPRTAVGTCPPRDGSTPTFLPDSETCDVYYECSNGVAYPKECPPGTAWDQDHKACADPLDFECKPPSATPLTAVGTCPPRDGSTPTFLPDSETCDVYYECSNGVAYPKECPPGTAWDQAHKACADPLDFECKPPSATPLAAVGTCPPRDGSTPTFLPDSETCDVYYECSNGVAYPKECPPGTAWDQAHKACADPLDFECKPPSATPLTAVGTCPPRDGSTPTFLPDSETCDVYYECSNGVAYPKECPPGTAWDQDHKACADPLDFECKPPGSSK